MTNEVLQIDSVDTYNKLNGVETLHPLVTVVDHEQPLERLKQCRLRYGLFALFLKRGDGCIVRYGREQYDYQEGTIVTFAPGQVVTVDWDDSLPMPPSRGLLFHPDLVYGTPLGKRMHEFSFFGYDQREALHLSERERQIVIDQMDSIEHELQHPIDRHSQTIITDRISTLLDYCMRFYDRQFITRHRANSDVLSDFERNLNEYIFSDLPQQHGLPSVAYFADKACLSAGYFGDLIKKETGVSAQRYIQQRVIGRAKQLVMDNSMTINQIAYSLGFQYPQHFTRLFKRETGLTPKEYRSN